VKSLVHAQTETVALHRPYLYRYALSKLRRTDSADDVVQETLMAALEGKTTFRGDSALRTWLTGILKHKIVDWQRREARNPLRTSATRNVDIESEYEDTTDALFDSAGGWVTPPSAWPNPEQSLENQPFRELLDRCLAALPAAAVTQGPGLSLWRTRASWFDRLTTNANHRCERGVRVDRVPASDPGLTHRANRAADTAYMCCAIVSGFLSLTISAIVKMTVWLPSFFHQCLRPLDSRAISPA